MKLLDMYISGYGKFHNRFVTFEDGLNLVYGRNEAGKSTLHSFIRSMLFGMERQRGRAAKTDQFSRFKPWDNRGGYEGKLRLESGGHIYRIERDFQNLKEFSIVDETLGRSVEPTKALMDRLLCGLTETAYSNTISIGQLKSATDGGMVTELKNYIANMNASGNMALNITKASAYLKNQRKEFDKQIVPEAARSYTALLGEIRNIEKEISAPEYENHLTEYQKKRAEVLTVIKEQQSQKEELLQKIARGHQVLETSHFTDEPSIQAYEEHGEKVYEDYLAAKTLCEKRLPAVLAICLLVLGIGLAACGVGLLAGLLSVPGMGLSAGLTANGQAGAAANLHSFVRMIPALLFVVATVSLVVSGILFIRRTSHKKDMAYGARLLQEIFSRHLGDDSVSPQAFQAFQSRMDEFKRLSRAVTTSETAVAALSAQMDQLQSQQTDFGTEIEKQQKFQWELEKKLERLDQCKTQAEALKDVLAENDRITGEIAAIDLAMDTMTGLSTSIRDSFGLYLNKEASELIDGITGGIYNSMSVDENLNVFMNTKQKLVPIDQVSSGTMDQIYLALRLAAAKLIQNDSEGMPLIFDDSFVLYDDDRLKTALKWLVGAFKGQIIIFTCHEREAKLLEENEIPYNAINM